MSVYLHWLRIVEYKDGTATFTDDEHQHELHISLDKWNELDRAEFISVDISAQRADYR